MSKFNVGDKVTYSKEEEFFRRTGDIFTIKNIFINDDDESLYTIECTDRDGSKGTIDFASEKYIRSVEENNMNNKLDIDIYDMLVFEDAAGNIYQDCVDKIINSTSSTEYIMSAAFYIVPKEIDYNDRFKIPAFKYYTFKEDNFGNDTFMAHGWYRDTWTLKEIWKRTNENTYTKIEVEQ